MTKETHQFITWPKSIDAKFRAAYLIETREVIDIAKESSDGLTLRIGSSRATSKQLDNLRLDTNITTKSTDIKNRAGQDIDGWIEKELTEGG